MNRAEYLLARASAFAFLAAVLTLGTAGNAYAQNLERSAVQTVTASFANAGPNLNGYQSAAVQVEYRFAFCGTGIRVLYNLRPDRLSTSGPYWFEGAQVALPSQRESMRVVISATVRRGGQVLTTFSDDHLTGGNTMDPGGSGCAGRTQTVGDLSLVGPSPTRDQMQQYLNSLSLTVNSIAVAVSTGPGGVAAGPSQAYRDRAHEVQLHLAAAERRQQERQAAAQAERDRQAAAQRAEQERQAEARRQQQAQAQAQQNQTQGAGTAAPSRPAQAAAPSNVPGSNTAYVRSTDGGYWVHDASGQYRQISQSQWEQGRAQEAAARQQAAQQQEAERRAATERQERTQAERRAEEARRQEDERMRGRAEIGAATHGLLATAIADGHRVGLTMNQLRPSGGLPSRTFGAMTNFMGPVTYVNMGVSLGFLGYLLADSAEGAEASVDDDPMTMVMNVITGSQRLVLGLGPIQLAPAIEAGMVMGFDTETTSMFFGGPGLILRWGGLDLLATMSIMTSTYNYSLGTAIQF